MAHSPRSHNNAYFNDYPFALPNENCARVRVRVGYVDDADVKGTPEVTETTNSGTLTDYWVMATSFKLRKLQTIGLYLVVQESDVLFSSNLDCLRLLGKLAIGISVRASSTGP